ncbi:hypothetical protein NQ318_023314, partial [Aromia moschata]
MQATNNGVMARGVFYQTSLYTSHVLFKKNINRKRTSSILLITLQSRPSSPLAIFGIAKLLMLWDKSTSLSSTSKCNPSGHSEVRCHTVSKTEVSRSLEQVTWFFSRYTVASFLAVGMKRHEFLEGELAVWWTDVSNSGFSLF